MTTIGIRCKQCGMINERELPEPKVVEKIVQSPCRCGMTEDVRQCRQWVTLLGIVAVVGLIAGAACCHSTNVHETKKVELLKDQYTIKKVGDGWGGFADTATKKTPEDKLSEENVRRHDETTFWRTVNEHLRLTNQELRERLDKLQAEIERMKQERSRP